MPNLFSKPIFHISLLTFLLLILFLFTSIPIPDNNFVYQKFTENLAAGKLDLTIQGFHGADFLAVPIYLIFKTHLSVIYLDLLLALLCVPMFYLLGKELFQSKKLGIFLAYAYVLMPLDYLNGFRGDHHIAFIFFFALGLYLILKKSWWSVLVIGFSYIIKPYAIFAAPFFWYKKLYKQFFASFIIPVIYIALQLYQKSQLIIGDHENLTAITLFSLKKFVLNLVYALQNIFSIHSFSPFSKSYLTDMSHITPIIMFLALIAVCRECHSSYNSCHPDESQDPIDKRHFIAIILTAFLGLIIPCAFEYLDLWRLIVFYLMIIILALPVLQEYLYLLPVTVGLSGFQFFYAYLAHQNTLWPSGNKMVFVVWGVIFMIASVYTFLSFPRTRGSRC